MLFLALKWNTKQDTAKERTHLFSFIKCVKKFYRKKQWTWRWEKTSKAMESKLTVTIKRLFWEFDLYCNFMFTDKKMMKVKRTKELTTQPVPPSTPITVFLIVEKLLNLWLCTLQFSDFHFFSINFFVEKLSVIVCLDYFLWQTRWRWVIWWFLTSSKPKWSKTFS